MREWLFGKDAEVSVEDLQSLFDELQPDKTQQSKLKLPANSLPCCLVQVFFNRQASMRVSGIFCEPRYAVLSSVFVQRTVYHAHWLSYWYSSCGYGVPVPAGSHVVVYSEGL